MEVLSSIGGWIWTNLCSDAAVFMMILVLVGQILARRTVMESIGGAIKCYIGYQVYTVATGGLSSTFRPILYALKDVFGVSITVNDSYYGLATMQTMFNDMGGNAGLQGMILGIAFGLMILFALFKRITKIRTLVVQGHILANNALRALMICFMLYPFMPTYQLVIFAAFFFAIRFAVFSNLTVEAAQDLTNGVGMAVGHTQMIGDRIAWEIGRFIEKRSLKKTGKKPHRLDDIEFPKWLNIFNDIYVACFIVMFVFFGIVMLILGKENLMTIDSSLTESKDFFMYIFATSMKFPIYLVILFTGMRMFVAEIMIGFEGLSQRVLHGTLPALDCAAFYGFVSNPNVITVGFLSGTLVMILCTLIGVIFNFPIIVMMGFTQMMFDNATMGIFGHHRGGVKGLLISAGLCGFVDTMGGALVAFFLGTYKYFGVASQFDESISLGTLGAICKIGPVGMIIMLVIIALIPQIQYALCKDKESYFLVASDYEKYKERQEKMMLEEK